LYVKGIARQQWRARIETKIELRLRLDFIASPASNGGRGLKHAGGYLLKPCSAHRPPAMAGAD